MPQRSIKSDDRAGRALLIRRAIGFAAAFGITLLLALDGGGYDEALRHKLGLALWVLIGLGLAFGVLPRSRMNTGSTVALAGFAALAALTLLSMTWTESDERTFAEFARVLQYLAVITLAYLSLNRYTWRGAAAGLAAAALVVPFFAILSRLAPDLITDEAARALFSDRLSHPFGYWNAVGAWGAMAVAIGLCWSGHARAGAVRSLALAAVPVAALSVYLSYSRGGVIATAIAVLAAVALSANRWTVSLNAVAAGAASAAAIAAAHGQDEIATGSGNAGADKVALVLVAGMVACAVVAFITSRAGVDRLRLPRQTAQVATGVAAVAALLGVAALNGPIDDAWDEFRNEDTVAPSADPAARLASGGGSRYVVWTKAIDAFEADSARGIGPGSFEFYWSREADDAEFLRDAHSLYLETLAELGLPGLLCLIVAFGGLIAAAFAARSKHPRGHELGAAAALAAAFAVFLFSAGIDWMWEMGAVGTLALAGIAVAGAGGLERRGSRRPPIAATVAASIAAFALAASQVPSLVSHERIQAADAELTDANLGAADRLASDAVQAEPWAASPYALRALVAQAAGRVDDARDDLAEAIEREPTNFRHRLSLALLESETGDDEAARRELRRARGLAPKSPLLLPTSPQVIEIIGGSAAPAP